LATGAGGDGGVDAVASGCAGATSTGVALLEACPVATAAGLSAGAGVSAAGGGADSGWLEGAAAAGWSAGVDGDPQPAASSAMHINAPPSSCVLIMACLSVSTPS
jgi:hypothetical protein